MAAAAAGQWYFKSDLRFRDDEDGAWQRYSSDDNDTLEAAYKRGTTVVTLDRKYRVNLDKLIQFRIDDESRQRPVKRVALGKKRGRGAEIVGEHVFVVCIANDRSSDDAEVVGVYASRDAAIAKRRRKQDKLSARGLHSTRVWMQEIAIKP